MTACVNCARALQPAWKYCIYCGTRTAVAATAPRSRPMPRRTPVPGYASMTTAQTPIVPPPAPAPLSAAPAEEPVSSEWPETMGERPSLRSAIAATEVPAPTPPREDAPAPDDEEPIEFDDADLGDSGGEPDEPSEPDEPEAPLDALPAPDAFADALADAEDDDEPLPEPTGFSIADLAHETDFDDEPVRSAEPEDLDDDLEAESGRDGDLGDDLDDDLDETPGAHDIPADDDEPEQPRRSVNTLAILALFIGILACPFAALFGHLALGQLKVSGERGVVPAWIAVVLGYLWLGFWIVFGVTYFATNG